MRIKEFTGKTTQEAIDNGLAELGVTIADVHVDVLQEGAKGLFGLFGSKPACVRLTVMEDKREDSLRRLAQRMANRAVKTGRKVVLEPMNPYERRVLHTALQNHPAVTTHSEGEEPNRRVVIMLKNQPERPEKSAEKPQGEKPSRSRRSRRRGPRKPVNPAENQTANEPQETVAAPESPAAVDVLGVEE